MFELQWIFFVQFSHAPLALLDKRTHTHMRIGKKKYRCYAKHACLNCNENFSKKSLLAIQNTYVWIAMKFFSKFSHAPLALLTYTRVRTHTCVGKKNLVAMQNIYVWIAMKFYLVFIGIQTHAFCIATRLSWMYVKCVWFQLQWKTDSSDHTGDTAGAHPSLVLSTSPARGCPVAALVQISKHSLFLYTCTHILSLSLSLHACPRKRRHPPTLGPLNDCRVLNQTMTCLMSCDLCIDASCSIDLIFHAPVLFSRVNLRRQEFESRRKPPPRASLWGQSTHFFLWTTHAHGMMLWWMILWWMML